MSGLAEFLKSVFDYVGTGWPLKIVLPWERGIRISFGRMGSTDLLSTNGLFRSGVHWHWPLLGSIYTWECNVEVFETNPQTVRSRDGKEVTFTLGVQAQIANLRLFYENVSDELKTTVADATRSAAGLVAAQAAYVDFNDELCATIRKTAAEQMAGWGVKIRRVGFVTLTTAPVLRVIQSSSYSNTI